MPTDKDRESSRYPYTYAYDFLRQESSTKVECNISRGECSLIVGAIAEVLGRVRSDISKDEICVLLAEQYLAEKKSGKHREKMERRMQASGLLPVPEHLLHKPGREDQDEG